MVLLVINAKIDIGFSNGLYYDFDSSWLETVGSLIGFTMVINIFTIPIANCFMMIILYLKRKLDKGCCCMKRKDTRKKYQKDYEDLYIGPQFLMEFRSAQFLNIMWV